MTVAEVDSYLASVEEPHRSTLEALRESILAVVPDAEQCISYGVPAFRVGGEVVAGFAAFKQHLAYLPHSGAVLDSLGARLDGYECTKGSLHFAIDQPLPVDLVKCLIDAKLELLASDERAATSPAGPSAPASRRPNATQPPYPASQNSGCG